MPAERLFWVKMLILTSSSAARDRREYVLHMRIREAARLRSSDVSGSCLAITAAFSRRDAAGEAARSAAPERATELGGEPLASGVRAFLAHDQPRAFRRRAEINRPGGLSQRGRPLRRRPGQPARRSRSTGPRTPAERMPQVDAAFFQLQSAIDNRKQGIHGRYHRP